MTALEIYTLFVLLALVLAIGGAGYLWARREAHTRP
jgi:hypothetical protein